jgi:hypothetical protein
MARIPRYQETGALSGDIPAISFPNLTAQANLQQGIGASLDKLAQFAFGEAKERQDKENKILAIQMRADLEAEVAKEIEKIDLEVTTGKLSDFGSIQNRVKSLQGYANPLYERDVAQASGLMQSITASGKALLNKSSKLLSDAYGTERDRVTDQAIKSYARSFENAWQTMGPEELDAFQSRMKNIVSGIAFQNPASYNKYMGPGGEYDKMATAARNNSMAGYFMSPEFNQSGTATEMISKLNKDDAGKYSQQWQKMGFEERKALFDLIDQRTTMIKKGVDAQYANAGLEADPIIRKIMNSDDPAEQTRLYGLLKELPLDPAKLQSVRTYINSDQAGAATDDVRTLIELSSKSARGELTADELVNNRGKLTKATIKSLALQIANPNDAMQEGNRVLELAVGIQSSNLPPEIETAEGKAAAVNAVNKSKLELIRFKNTPDETGRYPSDAQIRQKVGELQGNLQQEMSPIFNKAASGNQNAAAMFIPELTGVDLMNDAAVNQAFAAAANRKPKPAKPDDISQARTAIERYRQNINRAGGQRQGDRPRGGQ